MRSRRLPRRSSDDERSPVRWSERRPMTKVLVVVSVILVFTGLVLAVVAVVLAQWAGLGTAVSLMLGGGVGYWLATRDASQPRDDT